MERNTTRANRMDFLAAAFWAVFSGCAATHKTDEAVREWDRLSAQSVALQERIDLRKGPLASCNSQRMDKSAAIPFQQAMIEDKVRVIEQQQDRLSNQQSTIREQARTINAQQEAVAVVALAYP